MSIVTTTLRSITFAFFFAFTLTQLSGAMYEPNEAIRAELLDSLKNAKDHERPILLNQIAESYTYTDSTKLRTFADKALREARRLKIPTSEVRALRNLGNSYQISGDYDNALKYLHEATHIKECTDLSLHCNVNLALALIYFSGGLAKEAEGLLEEAYAGFQSLGAEFDMTRVRLNQTRFAIKKGALGDAVNFFESAVYHANLSKSDQLHGHLKMIEGLIYISQERYEEAISSLMESVTFFEAQQFFSANSMSLVHLAVCYQHTGKLQLSNEYAKRAIQEDNSISAPHLVVLQSYQILAENAASIQDFKKAYEMSQNAQKIGETLRVIDLGNQLTIMESFKKIETGNQQRIVLEKINHSQARAITLGSLLTIAAIVLLILVLRHNRILRKTQLKEHELTQKLRQQQGAILTRNKDLAEMISHRDRLYSIVAHDLKSPIGALHGLMQSLTKEDLQKEETLELLQSIAPSVQSTYELIERLVEWAQTQHMELKPKPERVNLYKIYQAAIIQMAPFIDRKQITINPRLAVNHEVFFDRGMLLSIMRSLLSNSVKFTNEKGSIELRSLPDLSGFTITNSGKKIPSAVIEALNTNQTVESSFGTAGEKGTGLGLIITRTLLDANGGAIEFSTDETGSKVVVSLPRPQQSDSRNMSDNTLQTVGK